MRNRTAMFKNFMLVLSLAVIACIATAVWFAGRAQYWAIHVSDPVCLTLQAEAGPGNACEQRQTAAEQTARFALAGAGLFLATMLLSLVGFWGGKRKKQAPPVRLL